MYEIARRLLFQIPPETSHHLAIASLRALGRTPGPIHPVRGTAVRVAGLEFRNRVGLAAGLDKDARAVEGLARLGFGFVEVGTVTPKPQPGNPTPRLFRLARDRALINRMGFNNAGVDAMARELTAVRDRGKLEGTLVGINLGKNKDTLLENAEEDYLIGLRRLRELGDYFTLNLSSPNTPGLRELQTGDALVRLLDRVKSEVAGFAAPVPVFIKVAPDLTDGEIGVIAEKIVSYDVDGLIATNTTIGRPMLETVANEEGGLSGRPLQSLSRAVVAKFRRELPEGYPIVGVGGIDTELAGRQMLDAGASLLQIYTSLIYEGPVLVRRLARL
jgi:dihydroorotate dehydrogenase